MIFLFEILTPIFFAVIFTVLYERWKGGAVQSAKTLFFLSFARLIVCFLSVCLALFIFGYLLEANETQLMIIIAVVFGVTYAVVSHLLELKGGSH